MKTKVKELLQEFIERDFTISEINDVISTLHDIEADSRLIKIYNKYGEKSLKEYWRGRKQEEKEVLAEIMADYSLKYQIDDLVS